MVIYLYIVCFLMISFFLSRKIPNTVQRWFPVILHFYICFWEPIKYCVKWNEMYKFYACARWHHPNRICYLRKSLKNWGIFHTVVVRNVMKYVWFYLKRQKNWDSLNRLLIDIVLVQYFKQEVSTKWNWPVTKTSLTG